MNAERKWIRLQEIGFAQFLAIPVVILIFGMVTGFTIHGDLALYIGNLLPLMILILTSSGYCCFRIGYEKRREIIDKEDNNVLR